MAATSYLNEDDLKGSDSDNVQYMPKILKTFKVGIDRITSLVAVFDRYKGNYTAICNDNFNELTFCDKDGEIIVRNLNHGYRDGDVRDLGFLMNKRKPYDKSLLAIAYGQSIFATDLERAENSSQPSSKSSVNYKFSEMSGKVLSETECITGICRFRSGGIVACHASEQSYEPTHADNTRYVAVYKNTIYSENRLGYAYVLSPEVKIEYKHSADTVSKNKKEPMFTYPKRITESDIGDLWIVDRKSSNHGDIKVCDTKGNLKFIYSGGPIGFKFDPVDVCSNKEDVLVIADCSNHKIHLVRNDGVFIQYLMTEQQGLQLPTAICVDMFQRAWVGCDDGTVHIILYDTFQNLNK